MPSPQAFIKSFRADTPFWDLTKQRALSVDTLDFFRKQLKILDSPKFTNRWDGDAQRAYSKLIFERHLIEFHKMNHIMKEVKKRLIDTDSPQQFFDIIASIYRKYVSGMGSSAANARIIASLANKLGFLYEIDRKLVFTEAGRIFARTRNTKDMISIVAEQLEKWVFWNPDVMALDRKVIELFPFRFVVKVAALLDPAQLTTDEMAAFVMTATNMSQISERSSLIQEFRKLSDDEREKLLSSLGNQLVKLSRFVSYIFSAFAMTGAFRRDAGTITLDHSNGQVQRILKDDFPYFQYPEDETGLRLYYEYYGSPKLAEPHREVVLDVADASGQLVDFAHVRIIDSQTRYSLVKKGQVRVVLPLRNLQLDIISFSTGKEAVLATTSVATKDWKVSVKSSAKIRIEKRDFDTCFERLKVFRDSDPYDPELAALVRLKLDDSGNESDVKQVRGGRFEQLVWELLQSITPSHFDDVEWEGKLETNYGIPLHATGYKHDLTIKKGGDVLILEVTLAGKNQQQGKDLSVQNHMVMKRASVKGNLVGVFVVTRGFYSQVLQNLKNDQTNMICPMTLDEFLQVLQQYRRSTDYDDFLKKVTKFHGRTS